MARARRKALQTQFLCKATAGVSTYKLYYYQKNFGKQIFENKILLNREVLAEIAEN